MKKKVSISFLSSKDVVTDLIKLDKTDINYIHIDVMDGKFVKNKNDPFKYLNKMSKFLSKRLDVHLMVNKPKKYIDKYADLNVEYITIHPEIGDVSEYFEQIKSYGIKCGISLKPDTDLNILEYYLDKIDMILVMSVEPGYGGQEFIKDSIKRVNDIKKIIGKRNITLSIDGGINEQTSKEVNTNIVVSGSYVINSDNFQDKIDKLR